MERGHDRQITVPAWNPSFVLDEAPLLASSSIRDFQQGKVGYVADAMEKALLLPRDLADLRLIRKHEVFLTLKRDLSLVSFLTTFFTSGIIIDRLIVIHYYFFFFGRLSKLHTDLRSW